MLMLKLLQTKLHCLLHLHVVGKPCATFFLCSGSGLDHNTGGNSGCWAAFCSTCSCTATPDTTIDDLGTEMTQINTAARRMISFDRSPLFTKLVLAIYFVRWINVTLTSCQSRARFFLASITGTHM
jgi:hypothetical protein